MMPTIPNKWSGYDILCAVTLLPFSLIGALAFTLFVFLISIPVICMTIGEFVFVKARNAFALARAHFVVWIGVLKTRWVRAMCTHKNSDGRWAWCHTVETEPAGFKVKDVAIYRGENRKGRNQVQFGSVVQKYGTCHLCGLRRDVETFGELYGKKAEVETA